MSKPKGYIVQGQYRDLTKLKEGINRGIRKWKDLHICASRDDAEYMLSIEPFWPRNQLRIIKRS